MCQTVSSVDVGFIRESFAPGTHICLLFRDEIRTQVLVANFAELQIRETAHPSSFTSRRMGAVQSRPKKGYRDN